MTDPSPGRRPGPRRTEATRPTPWWRGAVIYQVYPRSFLDTNGDGVGDLPGIIARLDYIRDLGVDALWISPFFRSPMKDFGYDVADYRAVDPLFGCDADADALIAAAHERGLKVVIDMVLGHSSDQHPWFRQSRASRDNPKAGWYVWADPRPDGTPPNNWLSVFGGPSWQWGGERGQYYLHHFLASQPNLDWNNPEVVEAMLAEAAHWLDRGVDGLRLDAITTLVHDPLLRDNPPRDPHQRGLDIPGAANSPHRFQEHVYDRDRPEILERFARLRALADRHGAFLMGEIADVDSIPCTAKYTSGPDRLHSGYNFQLTRRAFGVERLQAVIGALQAALGDGWATYAFSNHDVPRTLSRWGALPELAGDRPALAKLLLACLFTLPGTVCLYQGEELGLTEADIPFEHLVDPWGIEFWPSFKGRDGCRTPMPWQAEAPAAGFTTATPWLPIPDEHRALAVDRQEADPGSVLHACRRLLAWRRRHPALIAGAVTLRDTAAPVWAFERADGAERLLCAFNLSNRPAAWPVEPGWRKLDEEDGDDGHGFTAGFDGATVTLPPFGAFFAERNG